MSDRSLRATSACILGSVVTLALLASAAEGHFLEAGALEGFPRGPHVQFVLDAYAGHDAWRVAYEGILALTEQGPVAWHWRWGTIDAGAALAVLALLAARWKRGRAWDVTWTGTAPARAALLLIGTALLWGGQTSLGEARCMANEELSQIQAWADYHYRCQDLMAREADRVRALDPEWRAACVPLLASLGPPVLNTLPCGDATKLAYELDSAMRGLPSSLADGLVRPKRGWGAQWDPYELAQSLSVFLLSSSVQETPDSETIAAINPYVYLLPGNGTPEVQQKLHALLRTIVAHRHTLLQEYLKVQALSLAFKKRCLPLPDVDGHIISWSLQESNQVMAADEALSCGHLTRVLPQYEAALGNKNGIGSYEDTRWTRDKFVGGLNKLGEGALLCLLVLALFLLKPEAITV